MKKIKGHFWLPIPSHPIPSNKTFRGIFFVEKPNRFLNSSKDLLTPINGKSINWTPSEILRISLRGIKHFEAKKKIEKPYRFLKCSKDLLTPINGKSINWTPSEILRISLRGIKHFEAKKSLRNFIDICKTLMIS